MELEEALSRILDLEQDLTKAKDEQSSLNEQIQTLTHQNEQQGEQIKHLKEINMRYFERLTLEKPTPMKEESPKEEPLSWNDFMNQW